MKHYLANFQKVSVYASMELQKQFPNRTKEQITEAMQLKSNSLVQKVHDLVRDKEVSLIGDQTEFDFCRLDAKPNPTVNREFWPKIKSGIWCVTAMPATCLHPV